ncbi:4476_t:CDS:2, partial [Entrophospora sp. SA101]
VLYYKKKNTEVDEPRKIPFWKESEIQESEIKEKEEESIGLIERFKRIRHLAINKQKGK